MVKMKMKNKRRFTEFLVAGVLIVLMCSLVSAVIGFSKDYYNENPLKIGPGEAKEIVVGRLQNTNEEDRTLSIEILEGGDIASLIGPVERIVPAGKLDSEVRLSVSIPEGVAEGTIYEIRFRYRDVTPVEGEGMVTVATSSQGSIPVLVEKIVQEEEQPVVERNNILWWVLGVILVIVIIIIYMIRKKSSAED